MLEFFSSRCVHLSTVAFSFPWRGFQGFHYVILCNTMFGSREERKTQQKKSKGSSVQEGAELVHAMEGEPLPLGGVSSAAPDVGATAI